jgi:hypothetical protein
MPVTATLSKRFYEVLGEDVAKELVDWFNQVDATYRADLRELNELNFTRFDARLGERLAQLEKQLAQQLAELESRLTWRMFAFWAPTALAVIGTGAGVLNLLLPG